MAAASGESRGPHNDFPQRLRFAPGPSLGQCCGGVVHLAFERVSASDLPELAATLASPGHRWRCSAVAMSAMRWPGCWRCCRSGSAGSTAVTAFSCTTCRRAFRRRLEVRGFSPDELAHITCLIGVAGIAGKEPEVIAVAVAAQRLQALNT